MAATTSLEPLAAFCGGRNVFTVGDDLEGLPWDNEPGWRIVGSAFDDPPVPRRAR